MDWININDKLPTIEKKYGYECLCYYVNHRTEKRTYRLIGILHYSKGKFYYGFVGNVTKEVTHWTPFPNKPKIGKNN